MDLPKSVQEEIVALAKKYHRQKVILHDKGTISRVKKRYQSI